MNNNNEINLVDEDCYELHRLFNNLPRLRIADIKEIPFDNGIYIVFENGEYYQEMDRIVRVGTHRADKRLKKRLRDHLARKNKDGSIFRKNIGKAILAKQNDPYLDIWATNTSNRSETIKKLGDKFDIQRQKEIEDQVTKYMLDNLSFICFEVKTEEERLRLEEGLIATLNCCKNFNKSIDWLGNYSPVEKIKESGLWLIQGLNKQPLTYQEVNYIKTLVNKV